jgi:dephospho-CoA kinase
MSKLTIALTGGIASGKSKVSKIFQRLGASVIDLDDISRMVVMPGTDGLKELVTSFSNDILSGDGTLDRKKLRKLLTESKHNQHQIESILHPKILKQMQADINNLDNGIVIVEVALLAETDNTHLFDRAIVVDCDEHEQLTRLKMRDNISDSDAKGIIAAQVSRKDRLKIANKLPTDVINNDSQISDLEKKASSLYKELIESYCT